MALAVRWAPTITLSRMAEWRKKHRRWKPLIDAFRGIVLTALMMPRRHDKRTGPPSLEMIDRVCLWFEATGDFREEALRFIRWRGYWGTLSREDLDVRFLAIGDLACWFRERAESVLGVFTQRVEEFRQTREKSYRWREDRLSCLRPRVEYHLNMIGAAWMNGAFRKEFMDAESTALLLPGCMRSHNDGDCRAKREDRGLLCMGCSRDCPVHALREKGKAGNFSVYILPHASDLSLWTPAPDQPKCRVVASACITTLVEGGYELRRYGVPAQCVPLDFSGCKKHWDPEGRTTSLCEEELHRLLSPESQPPSIA